MTRKTPVHELLAQALKTQPLRVWEDRELMAYAGVVSRNALKVHLSGLRKRGLRIDRINYVGYKVAGPLTPASTSGSTQKENA